MDDGVQCVRTVHSVQAHHEYFVTEHRHVNDRVGGNLKVTKETQMASLNIRGRVMAFPGNEGLQHANVVIIDIDSGGNGDDVIFSGTTDENGYFSGTSTDWVDTNTVRVDKPWPLHGSADVPTPDALALKVRIRKGGDDTGYLPFVNPPSGAPVVPIIVNIINVRHKPQVNGQDCSDGYELQKKAREALERGDPEVVISLYGPDATPFMAFGGRELGKLRDLATGRLPGLGPMISTKPAVANEMLAISLIILSVGAAYSVGVIATAVAFALILALILGYKKIWVEVSTGADGTVKVDFHVAKG